MVTGQLGLIFKIPFVDGYGTNLTMIAFLASRSRVTVIDSRLHLTVGWVIVVTILRVFGIAAIDGDTVINQKRGIQNVTVLSLRTLGGIVFSCCHIDGTLINTCGHHLLVQAVDGLLKVIQGISPRRTSVRWTAARLDETLQRLCTDVNGDAEYHEGKQRI